MKTILHLFVLSLVITTGCKPTNTATSSTPTLVTLSLNLPSSASFRGINGINNQVWLAGSNSEVWVYNTKTKVFNNVSPFNDSEIQYRDVAVLGTDTAIVMTAGFPAMLLKTTNGGDSWDTTLQDTNAAAFFDGLAFQNNKQGVLFGDPVNNKLQVYFTYDGGNTWTQDSSSQLNLLNPIEAGFAASGTSITYQNNQVHIGLGGTQARIFSKIIDKPWKASNTPMTQGSGSKGIYSLAILDSNMIAVGGQYDNPSDDSTRTYTKDYGETWQLGSGVNEYRSCVVFVNNKETLACGPSGIDISNDQGATWQKISDLGLNAIYWNKNTQNGYGSGANGRFYQLTINN